MPSRRSWLRYFRFPKTASSEYLRDEVDSELGYSRSAPQNDRQVSVEALNIVASDNTSYNGWRGILRGADATTLRHVYVFEKHGRIVKYRILDGGPDPVFTDSVIQDFVGGTLGGLVVDATTVF